MRHWTLLAAAAGLQLASVVAVKPLRATDALPMDPDDPAIWINRADASKSLILGTMKVAAPEGGLAVFGVDGKLRHLLKGPDRPNNVDVEYGLDLEPSVAFEKSPLHEKRVRRDGLVAHASVDRAAGVGGVQHGRTITVSLGRDVQRAAHSRFAVAAPLV
jgi:hypothetical protein